MLEDGAQFTSHAATPTLRWGADDETWVADRDIKDGEEITFDYRSLDTYHLKYYLHSLGNLVKAETVTGCSHSWQSFTQGNEGHLNSFVKPFFSILEFESKLKSGTAPN